MASRIPIAEGKAVSLTALPDGTLLNEAYTVRYKGVGGMSIVYEGRKDDERYFVKEVAADEIRKVMALTQEKAMLERLDHPAIPKVHDLFDYEGYFYLITDYIDGESLDSLVPSGAGVFIGEKEIFSWAWQLYEIFEYLHQQSPPIIFRDLKPHNIMRDRDGVLHLVDFGIARVYKENGAKDTVSMGTVLTASPEHYGGKQTDMRSDIFTLGATLHYLLTNGSNIERGLFNYCSIRDVNPALSPDLDRVILKAVEMLPGDRYQSIAEMRQAHLNAFQNKLDDHFKEVFSTKDLSGCLNLASLGIDSSVLTRKRRKVVQRDATELGKWVFSKDSAIKWSLVALFFFIIGFIGIQRTVAGTPATSSSIYCQDAGVPSQQLPTQAVKPIPAAEQCRILPGGGSQPPVSCQLVNNLSAMPQNPPIYHREVQASQTACQYGAASMTPQKMMTVRKAESAPPSLGNCPQNVFTITGANGSTTRYSIPEGTGERRPLQAGLLINYSSRSSENESVCAGGQDGRSSRLRQNAQKETSRDSQVSSQGSSGAQDYGFIPASSPDSGISDRSSAGQKTDYGFTPASAHKKETGSVLTCPVLLTTKK